jgi:trans-2,3-dihydro-3-hydroxyanthranilate isomerase
MEFLQVDVFTDSPYAGNSLAVFPEGTGLNKNQMQAVAREMNLAETTFVTKAEGDSYSLRIFTPDAELPFAGHPTIGTAWVLRHLGRVEGAELTQHSAAGATRVWADGKELWFERPGEASPDIEDRDPDFPRRLERALGLESGQVGLEARELGRSGMMRPGLSNAGFEYLIVPVRDITALEACAPRRHLLSELSDGAYCFTAAQAGRVRARAFFPNAILPEDPATGSAAAALGVYLADRIGDISFELFQGQEMGRPSKMRIRAKKGTVQVGGQCVLIFKGKLERLPD